MDLMEAIRVRHSVRQYTDEPLSPEHIAALRAEIDACNEKSGLHIQLTTNEGEAFAGFLAHYGWLSGVTDYIALVGPKGDDLDEKCGYYGERLVLKAQQLGLNTCWVAGTYKKHKAVFTVNEGEKLCLVIAIGYGKTQGVPHKGKSYRDVAVAEGEPPEWFKQGVEAALLAPRR